MDPESGAVREVPLPLEAEEAAFDIDGLLYLKPHNVVVRYELGTWREIPFDYGEQMNSAGQKIASAVRLPADSHWHQGGLWISSGGRIVAGCLYDCKPQDRPKGQAMRSTAGRNTSGESTRAGTSNTTTGPCMFTCGTSMAAALRRRGSRPWRIHGLCIDSKDNLYVLAAGSRVLDGQPYFNPVSCTLIKMPPKGGRIVSLAGASVPLADTDRPARPADMARTHGLAWVEGAAWFYGGIGWDGKKGIGCSAGIPDRNGLLLGRTLPRRSTATASRFWTPTGT